MVNSNFLGIYMVFNVYKIQDRLLKVVEVVYLVL